MQRGRGNVVLVDTHDAMTDFGISARIAAAFTGAFFTTVSDFAQKDSPEGIQYSDHLRKSKTTHHVAATAKLLADLPTLPHVLRTLAEMPGGCLRFYFDPEKLRQYVKTQKSGPRLLQRACVLSRQGEQKAENKDFQQFYRSPSDWILQFKASVHARFPTRQV